MSIRKIIISAPKGFEICMVESTGNCCLYSSSDRKTGIMDSIRFKMKAEMHLLPLLSVFMGHNSDISISIMGRAILQIFLLMDREFCMLYANAKNMRGPNQ